ADALRHGFPLEEVAELTRIDAWFLRQIEDLVREEQQLAEGGLASLEPVRFRRLKRKGFSDARIASLLKVKESIVRQRRTKMGLRPVYKRVDTCAAEFATATAYMYSTYEEECEAEPSDRS